MLKKIDHLGIVVRDIEEALKVYRDTFGLELAHIEEVPEYGAKVAFLPLGESDLELIEPLSAEGSLAKFLEKRGEGLHHLCLAVEDIEAALAELAARGLRLIDERPRPGGHGRRVAFLHPASAHGVLIELVEESAEAGEN